MALLVNPTVVLDRLVGYYDVLNPKSLPVDFNSDKKWYDLRNPSKYLQGLSSGIGAITPEIKFISGENTTIKSIATTSSSTGSSYLKALYSTPIPVRTISFWLKGLYDGTTNQGPVPYFFEIISGNVNDVFIDYSTGYGTGITGTVSYYNGIAVGNNAFFAQEFLFGSGLANSWKNITLVFPTTVNVSSLALFGKEDGTTTSGMSYAISQILLYNKELTMEQVASNFFAFKGRYSI